MHDLALLLALAAIEASNGQPASQPFFELKQARIDAYRKGDRVFFEQLLTDDFVGLGPDGRLSSKRDYLASEFHGDQRNRLATETTVEGFNAKKSGDVLVMTYEETEHSQIGVDEFTAHLRRLDTYLFENGRWRLRSMTAVRIPDAPRSIAIEPRKLAEFAGSYAFGPRLTSVVRIEGNKLLEQTSGQAEVELIPIGADTFYAPPDLEARVIFERDPTGKVEAQIYRSGNQTVRGTIIRDRR